MSGSKKTAAWRIFNDRYRVYVPTSLMYSAEYVAKYGHYVSGNAMVDQANANGMTAVNQTLAGLAALYAQGAPLDGIFMDEKKKKVAYETIIEHLHDWLRQANGYVHMDSAPPMEDFRNLEAIAMSLHHSVQYNTPTPQDVRDVRRDVFNRGRQRNPSFVAGAPKRPKRDENDAVKPYVSIVDEIERLIMENSR